MDFEILPDSPTPHPSTFVSVVAWIFIVLSGGATLISLLQNIMFWLVIRPHGLGPDVSELEHMPRFAGFMFSHFHLMLLLFLLVSATTFVAAIGLLRRRNWARVTFIGVMVLGIAWNLGSLALQFVMVGDMQAMMPMEHGPPEFATMMRVMQVFTAIIALGISGLFAWIIRKLSSAGIRTEFR